MKRTIKMDLPDGVHGVLYMKNSHYIELTDADGNVTRVNAKAVVRYKCDACRFLFLTFMSCGEVTCPVCREAGAAKPQWMVPQLSFVPEAETIFNADFDKKDE